MSKPVGERLAVVETEVKTVKDTVKDIKDSQIKYHAEIQESQARNHNDLVNQLSIMQATFVEKHEALDVRLKSQEEMMVVVQETLTPFTEFRRKMWGNIVKASLVLAIVSIILVEVIKYRQQS